MRTRPAMATYYFIITAVILLKQFETVEISASDLVGRGEGIDPCSKRVCVPKCCAINEYLSEMKKCVKYVFKNYTLDFTDMKVYDEERARNVSTVNQTMFLIPGKFNNKTFKNSAQLIPLINGIKTYLTVHGHYYMEKPNYYIRWIRHEREEICIDYVIRERASYMKPEIQVYVEDKLPAKSENYVGTYGSMVSSIFLPLVFVVYLMLPDLRNLGGKILMAYVFSLFLAYLLLFTSNVTQHSYYICIGLTLFHYYFFLSSFCWMNVISYDIWSTFRSYTKRSPIRRGDRNKFIRYCFYAWGLPLTLTVFVAVMNSLPLQEMPWIITPQIATSNSFFEDNSKFFYLHIPILIFSFINWSFFLITAFYVWRLNRGTQDLEYNSAGNMTTHRKQSDRFMVYVKLSVVMGLSWLFEVISWVFSELQFIWILTDVCNSLIGLAIFIIFVCKKKIFIKLKKRCLLLCSSAFNSNQWVDNACQSNENTKSDDQMDEVTESATVCMRPEGPCAFRV